MINQGLIIHLNASDSSSGRGLISANIMLYRVGKGGLINGFYTGLLYIILFIIVFRQTSMFLHDRPVSSYMQSSGCMKFHSEPDFYSFLKLLT